MMRILLILALLLAAHALIGCKNEASEPIWKQVKIGEIVLPPTEDSAHLRTDPLVSFIVMTFEIPAKDIGALEYLSTILRRAPASFSSYQSFTENGFAILAGSGKMWDKTAILLRAAGAELSKTNTLMHTMGQSSQLQIAELTTEKAIFYSSPNTKLQGAALEPGKLTMQIATRGIPTMRGACKVRITPAYKTNAAKHFLEDSKKAKSKEINFDAMSVELIMSPNDFVFLRPQKYHPKQITLDSLFFYSLTDEPTVKTYVILCHRISD